MYRLKSILIFLLTVCCAMGAGAALGADESPEPGGPVPVRHYIIGSRSDDRPEAPFDIREDIRRAQDL